ncbi:acetate kinase [Metamycoplasma subdolum]|uniref:Acetate kinase n=1 Tax=Metamycoplasma subdolum TaxID=92407 RepID=A0A3M0A9S3_9BACT|nr:acetate/propionate family kinase [Metamycoplasma subdolum]RMA79135.1 acetate kinase [Metamycoplasma subdolum]WPB50657.1 acetate/propionate family kinase [Metamycoplasma subdolum]
MHKESKKILIINAGSSSIKWSLFDDKFSVEANGICEKIKLPEGIVTLKFNGKVYEDKLKLSDFFAATKKMVEQWKEHNVIKNFDEISHVAYRIVNGGPKLRETVEVTDKTIKYLQEAIDLAPVHNPGALEAIEAFESLFSKAKHTLHFDTSFHATLPKLAYTYPLNAKLCEELNLRKYGFHGLNYQYVTQRMQEILGKKSVNLVILHIGNGASLCAVQNSKSIETSMGFTPLTGIMMGTRTGDFDPSLIPYIMKHKNLTIDEVMDIVNKKSGLYGVSKLTSDFRELNIKISEDNEDAKFAFELYCTKISEYLINYLNKIEGKIDALVFTAGVGENQENLRTKVIEKIKLINLKIDEEKNQNAPRGKETLISSKDSLIPIYIIPANEELLIAKEANKFK